MSAVTGIYGFDLDTPRSEIQAEEVEKHLSQGKTVLLLVRSEEDLYRPEVRMDDHRKGWYIVKKDATIQEIRSELNDFSLMFFKLEGELMTSWRPTYKFYRPLTTRQWLHETKYQLRHFNEGLYPPGQIPSRRTFLITNRRVVKAMFDRAGLNYKDLQKHGCRFSVKIPKAAAKHFPENLAFVDRERFWDFVQDSYSDPECHLISFTVHAHTRTEALKINTLGQIPEPVDSMWALIPR